MFKSECVERVSLYESVLVYVLCTYCRRECRILRCCLYRAAELRGLPLRRHGEAMCPRDLLAEGGRASKGCGGGGNEDENDDPTSLLQVGWDRVVGVRGVDISYFLFRSI